MQIVLASASPRRKELLERLNIQPIIAQKSISEKINSGELPEVVVMSLAFKKALAISYSYPDDIVIGADTIVVNDGVILGKPNDEGEAYKMLKNLSSKSHKVITGISILSQSKGIKIIDYESTIVKFRELSDRQIKNYIFTKEPLDKAGSYGIQGLGAVFVEKIDGCYFNVVGLPLSKLDNLLRKFFDYNII